MCIVSSCWMEQLSTLLIYQWFHLLFIGYLVVSSRSYRKFIVNMLHINNAKNELTCNYTCFWLKFQFVPHLICAATEDVHVFKQSAETELRKVTLKYPYAMKSMAVKGILLSQEVQCSFQDKKVLRGVNQNNIAVNNVVYDIIQTTRNSRHNFTKNVLQLFNKEVCICPMLLLACVNVI